MSVKPLKTLSDRVQSNGKETAGIGLPFLIATA